MSKDQEKKEVPDYVIVQWTGKNPPRIHTPPEWIKKVKAKKYDTFKVTFEVILRHDEEE